MSSLVSARTGRVIAWRDGIPLHYEYTAGVAGETFLRGLMEKKVIASKCPRCGETRLPPRTYCLLCYARTRIDVELLFLARLSALTAADLAAGGAKGRRRADVGFVTYEGVVGGLVHRILHEAGSRPVVGDSVRPVFASADGFNSGILALRGFATLRRGRAGNR